MKIFLTGGSGDLGKVLAYRLQKRGDIAIRFDIRPPKDDFGQFQAGSILDRGSLRKHLIGVDCIVHIAAWHGYHAFTRQKNVNEFWDLNVTGTFNAFQAALENQVKSVVLISSESAADKNDLYGWTKILSEEIAQHYFDAHHLNVLTLRPRAFIPYWNKAVYPSYIDWAKWYWKGAVHINDVAHAVMKSIDLLDKKKLNQHFILPVDGAYEYTEEDLSKWDPIFPGETFKKYYEQFYSLTLHYGLDPALKPTRQDITETKRCLAYQPSYSLKNLLKELVNYGEKGPPVVLD